MNRSKVRTLDPVRERASGPPVSKDDRTAFNEVFLPHMAEAFRFAVWLTGNVSDAEDVVQDAALRAFRGIRNFSALNARAWSLTIVRNTAFSWLSKNRPKVVVISDDLSPGEKHEIEHENALATRAETPEQIALFKADAEHLQQALAELPPQFREFIVSREISQHHLPGTCKLFHLARIFVVLRLGQQRLVRRRCQRRAPQ